MKSMNSGHMTNESRSLIIITTLILLKTTSNKTSLIAVRRIVRASLNLIDSLTRELLEREDDTSSTKEKDGTLEESSPKEGGTSGKRAPRWL
jgi:hypothetical protein